MALHEVRTALESAAATLSTGTATSLRAGDADYFLDLIEVTLSNNSTVGASVAFKVDGTTLKTIQVGAGNTTQLRFDAPLAQPVKGVPWLVDMEDITGTEVTVEATFIKNK